MTNAQYDPDQPELRLHRVNPYAPVAAQLWRMYVACQVAGFSRRQSFRLVKTALTANVDASHRIAGDGSHPA